MQPDLVRYIDESLAEKDDWGRTRLHISDLGVATDTLCKRQLKLRLMGSQQKPPSLGTRMMWDNGHRLQDRMLELVDQGLLDDGFYIADDRGSVNLGGILGEFDWLLEGDGGVIVVDVKSSRGNAFRRKGPILKEHHVAQIRGYMMATDALYGLLLYVDREGSNHPQVFRVERDDDWVIWALGVIRNIEVTDEVPPVLDNAMVTERMPRGPVGANKKIPGWIPPEKQSYQGGRWLKSEMAWQCQYCPFQGTVCYVDWPHNDWVNIPPEADDE